MTSHEFSCRHLGPSDEQIHHMLKTLGMTSLDQLTSAAIPKSIQIKSPLKLPEPLSEPAALAALEGLARQNVVAKSFIGMGYANTFTPSVIRRSVLENPGWYTQYTPYQAEISQGRLESLLNFQTLILELTGLQVTNASLLDEATAAVEAMMMARSRVTDLALKFLVSQSCHPQTIHVLESRARPLGIEILCSDNIKAHSHEIFGALLQYPGTTGSVEGVEAAISQLAHNSAVTVILACDLLSLTLLKSPSELGAHIALGNSQRFGVPLGFGGPHAGFLAATQEFARKMPGRIIGVSKDSEGKKALRLSLQTREQHIRREKATSNICTAQALLANVAAMYAVYLGPEGLKELALETHEIALRVARLLDKLGYEIVHGDFFDTVSFRAERDLQIIEDLATAGINIRHVQPSHLAIACDETLCQETFQNIEAVLRRHAP